MIALFGPGWGNYAIRGIVEVELPEAVPFWPQTPGWWLLLFALLLGIGRYAWHRHQQWLRDRYRREALAELDRLRQRLAAGDRESLRELAALLRATALAAGDRNRLASLSGEAWSTAVNAMAPDQPPVPVDELQRLAYAKLSSEDSNKGPALMDALGDWIQGHGISHA